MSTIIDRDADHQDLSDVLDDHAGDEIKPPRFVQGVVDSYEPLSMLAEFVDDCERIRISMENRIRSAEQGATYFSDDQVERWRAGLKDFGRVEARAVKDLEDYLKEHPLGDWVVGPDMRGVGYKSIARLLAAIGDPYVKPAVIVDGEVLEPARPRRGPQELFAFAGLHVVDGRRPRRRRGEQANWDPEVKKRAFVAVTAILYQKPEDSRYRRVFDAAREAASHKVHTHECVNSIRPIAGKPNGSNGCGTRANPEWGEVGSPWRPAHCKAHAIGVTARAILGDLYAESKRLHQECVR